MLIQIKLRYIKAGNQGHLIQHTDETGPFEIKIVDGPKGQSHVELYEGEYLDHAKVKHLIALVRKRAKRTKPARDYEKEYLINENLIINEVYPQRERVHEYIYS